MATHKPFRELIKPGSNFEFIGRSRLWIMISILVIGAGIATLFVNKAVRGDYLNWSTDFKGGTEIVFGFYDKTSNEPREADAGVVRQSLQEAGYAGIEVSGFSWTMARPEGGEVTVPGLIIRTTSFGALDAARAQQVVAEFEKRFADREILSAQWSGDRLYARTRKPITEEEGKQFFASLGDMEMKAWGEEAAQFTAPNQATGEYDLQFPVWGLERQFATLLESKLDNLRIDLVQSYAVGAKAGEELRNDGIESLFYAMLLILLYLVVRFDIRYAPGAVVALLHDALVVIGAFAVTWTEFSLTTVAALLTIIGYSVNDTVVIFDRIRENVENLKDKKLARIINISMNETLSRTLLTSLTLFVVTVMMNVFTTGVVRDFAFAMNVGVITGVYSSVFIAAPVILYLDNKFYGNRAQKSARGRLIPAKATSTTGTSDDEE